MHQIQHDDRKIYSILQFLAHKSSRVEIVKNNVLEYVYFPRLPYCTFKDPVRQARFTPSQWKKDRFLEGVNRSSARTKCEDLIRVDHFIITTMKTDYFLQNGFFISGLFSKYQDLWKQISLVLVSPCCSCYTSRSA